MVTRNSTKNQRVCGRGGQHPHWTGSTLIRRHANAINATTELKTNIFRKKFTSALASATAEAYPGFIRVISKFKGTDAANIARLYAGECYLILNDNTNAIKYLKDFSTSSKLFQARAYKLLGDAYADQGKNKDALDYYKKAAHHFKEDAENSSEALFLAAYLAQTKLNDTKQAVELFKELKEKFPNTVRGSEADKYLARLGVYTTE